MATVNKARLWMISKLVGLFSTFACWWSTSQSEEKLLPEKATSTSLAATTVPPVQARPDAEAPPAEPALVQENLFMSAEIVEEDRATTGSELGHEEALLISEGDVKHPPVAAGPEVTCEEALLISEGDIKHSPVAAGPEVTCEERLASLDTKVSVDTNGVDVTTVAEGEPTPDSEPVGAAAVATSPPALPHVPGLAEADLVVEVSTENKTERVKESGEAGARGLMAQRCGIILGQMARDGWEVRELNAAEGEFEVVLPAVRYELPLAVVSIPAPRFQCFTYGSYTSDGDYKERLIGDLVLQNGKDMINIEFRFPNKQFAISAAGWARCHVGHESDRVRMQVDVELGVQIPRVPGLTSVMDYFIKTYANQSAQDCVRALSTGADEIVAGKHPDAEPI